MLEERGSIEKRLGIVAKACQIPQVDLVSLVSL